MRASRRACPLGRSPSLSLRLGRAFTGCPPLASARGRRPSANGFEQPTGLFFAASPIGRLSRHARRCLAKVPLAPSLAVAVRRSRFPMSLASLASWSPTFRTPVCSVVESGHGEGKDRLRITNPRCARICYTPAPWQGFALHPPFPATAPLRGVGPETAFGASSRRLAEPPRRAPARGFPGA